MTSRPAHALPRAEFDPQLADELEQFELQAERPIELASSAASTRRSPFDGYSRTLTPDGGVLIRYTDLNRGLLCKSVKTAICLAVTVPFVEPLLDLPLFSSAQMLGAAALGLFGWVVFAYKVRKGHSVEIRPDCMIVDGTDIFWAEDIAENWPELAPDAEDPTRINISGICGTRYIDYMTANPTGEHDRTSAVLIAHMHEAMEQLWGRREVTFASSL